MHSVVIPIFRSRLFIYLHETGSYDPPVFGQPQCDDSTYAYSLNFKGFLWISRPNHTLTGSADLGSQNDYYVVRKYRQRRYKLQFR